MGGRFLAQNRVRGGTTQIARLGEQFENHLIEALRSAGFTIQRVNDGPVVVAKRGRDRYAIGLKAAMVARRIELRSLLASAVLEATAWTRQHGGSPIAAIAAPRLSRYVRQDLVGYRALVAPDVPMILLSYGKDATVVGSATLRDALNKAPTFESVIGHDRASKPIYLFSDLNSWLLKVLLAPRINPRFLTAPRNEIASSRELASMADVSQPSAWRFIRELKNEGFIRGLPPYKVLQARALLTRWSQSLARCESTDAVWLLPRGNHAAQLNDSLRQQLPQIGSHEGHRMCLALFGACEVLGLGHARGVVPHVYLEDLVNIETLGLAPASEGETPHVVVRRPVSPESVFRAMVVVDGVPTADALQCWLDTVNHRARGREQAEFIWSKLLGPALESDD